MKKLLLAALLAVSTLFATPTIKIGTGGINGNYYPMGGDVATIFDRANSEIEKQCKYDLNIEVVEGKGSIHNLKQINKKKINAGIVQMDVLMFQKRLFPGKINDKKLKIIAGLHKESLHLMMPINFKPTEPKSSGWSGMFSSFSPDKPVKLELSTLTNQTIESKGGSVVSAKAISSFNNLNAKVIDTKGKWSGNNPILLVGGQPYTEVQQLLDTGKFVLISLNYSSIKAAAPFYLEDTLSYEIGGTTVEVPSVGVQALLVGKQLRSKKKNIRMSQLSTCLSDEEILGEMSDRDDTNNNWDSVYDLSQHDINIDWDTFPLMDDYEGK
jgi:hypothetical protein